MLGVYIRHVVYILAHFKNVLSLGYSALICEELTLLFMRKKEVSMVSFILSRGRCIESARFGELALPWTSACFDQVLE